MAKFDPIKLSVQIMFISMLHIWNLRYSRHFWIFCHSWLEITHSIAFFPKSGFPFPIKRLLPHRSMFAFIIPLFFSCFYRRLVVSCFVTKLLRRICRRPVAACFIANLLRLVVVSFTVSFFHGFSHKQFIWQSLIQ